MIPRSIRRRGSAVIVAAAAITTLVSGAATAGDRRLEVLFVNMTPDDRATKDSKTCVDAIREGIAEDYTQVTRLGESKLRAAVGKPAGEPFLDWEHPLFAAVKARGDTQIDAVVLIDCRPEARTFDALIVPRVEGTARLRLRGRALGAARVRWLSQMVLRRAWLGFSP